MTMKTLPLAALVAALGFGTSAAMAQDAQPSFAEIDTNEDGLISRAEASAHPGLATVFDQADANQDGVLDRMEFQAALRLLQEERPDRRGS